MMLTSTHLVKEESLAMDGGTMKLLHGGGTSPKLHLDAVSSQSHRRALPSCRNSF